MSILNHVVKKGSAEVSLQQYKGSVLLVVNVASMCGFTHTQYPQLQELHARLSTISGFKRGFSVLAFPSNDFAQEPLGDVEACDFAHNQFNVTFPVFDKMRVKGARADPLFHTLAMGCGGQFPRWNFTKYLCDADGIPFKRYDVAAPFTQISLDAQHLMSR